MKLEFDLLHPKAVDSRAEWLADECVCRARVLEDVGTASDMATANLLRRAAIEIVRLAPPPRTA